MSGKKIRVLVIDDSQTARLLLTAGLETDPGLTVVGSAEDPYDAWDKIRSLRPEVLTLDVNMPRMDGIEFLKRLLPQYPVPVVMVSSDGSESVTLRALAAGAFDFVAKPRNRAGFESMIKDLRSKIHAAATGRLGRNDMDSHKQAAAVLVKDKVHKVIAIGASTGGTRAIEAVLRQLPPGMPGIVITQHMPAGYTRKFAERLNDCLPFEVMEARDGVPVEPGHVYIAPGGLQMTLGIRRGEMLLACRTGEKVEGHAPSVDVLFHSVAKHMGRKAVGALLTGMGRDGAKGLKAMKDAGALTVAQDEASSMVFGMPRAAIALEGHCAIKPLNRIGRTLVGFLTSYAEHRHSASA